jgi:hypothetical protein
VLGAGGGQLFGRGGVLGEQQGDWEADATTRGGGVDNTRQGGGGGHNRRVVVAAAEDHGTCLCGHLPTLTPLRISGHCARRRRGWDLLPLKPPSDNVNDYEDATSKNHSNHNNVFFETVALGAYDIACGCNSGGKHGSSSWLQLMVSQGVPKEEDQEG